ncbi:MAG: HAMP domain-containing sensor histidine kinase [Erysipelotrichaceae bacterium]|nr:HAMP domain-containing sensor histidine kinase [Erysipelotrichaceae bacterium]
MKRNFIKGLKFNVWLQFFLVALGVVLIMGILQFSLIKPYFRDNKVQSVKALSVTMEQMILEDKAFSKALQMIVDNNLCAMIVNKEGKVIYSGDSLGASCAFNQNVTIDDFSFVPNQQAIVLNDLTNNNNGELNMTLTNTKTQQEMIIYGKLIKDNLSDYYLYINSPLEPYDSLIAFFINQYLFYMLIIVIISIVLATFLSNKLTKPIVNMKKSADILATGNYDVHFNNSYYNELNDLANTLNDATSKLSKVDELRKDLIANVSHDIKTPLTMIKAYAEMIIDISGDNKVKREEHLNVIINEADYLDHLVSDMSELSKLQSGNYILQQANFDIVKIIKEIINIYQVLIDDQHIDYKYIGDESVIVFADEIKIKQVIQNFISNAIKYTENGAKLIVKVIKLDDAIRVEVIDNGQGIKQEDLPYIWDRYYKIDKSFRRKQQSSGLGLAIVKAILDAHDASYGVISEEGKGSCFYFELVQENVF